MNWCFFRTKYVKCRGVLCCTSQLHHIMHFYIKVDNIMHQFPPNFFKCQLRRCALKISVITVGRASSSILRLSTITNAGIWKSQICKKYDILFLHNNLLANSMFPNCYFMIYTIYQTSIHSFALLYSFRRRLTWFMNFNVYCSRDYICIFFIIAFS